MPKLLKYFLYFLGFLLILSICVIVPVDRSPYNELWFYEDIDSRVDSLESKYLSPESGGLKVGLARVSITPQDTTPLAGYSGREPMEFNEILDSVYVRALVLDNGLRKVAIVSAELLILHPEIADAFMERAEQEGGWNANDIYLSATHTHSSIGGWSHGYVGELVTGEFDPQRQQQIVEAMALALEKANHNTGNGAYTYANSELGKHVKNRLIKEGEEDAWVRNLFFQRDSTLVALTSYSAHATCFNAHSNFLTGDYPSYFNRRLEEAKNEIFSMYLAGAVGSMGPEGKEAQGAARAKEIGDELAAQVLDLSIFGLPFDSLVSLDAFRLQVPLRSPQLKISRNLKLRPWVFRRLVGEYNTYFSVLKINNTLLIGMPCDFSGEVALPLYEYAKSKGLNLIITSFNGRYMGYVTKDEWYDLGKYETRTMNWYGPDSGMYFSEIIRRIIDSVKE